MEARRTHDPAAVYSERLAEMEADFTRCEVLGRRMSWARVAAAGWALAVGVVVSEGSWLTPWWLLPPVATFVVLVALHAKVARRELRAKRLGELYRRGLVRLAGKWQGNGPMGEEHLPGSHPYAVDLDLFGAGSLFQLVTTCRTGVGGETVARWLLEPAAPGEIRKRQEAVAELAPRLGLREDLELVGEEVRGSLSSLRLLAWAEAERDPAPRIWSLASLLASVATITAMAGWVAGLSSRLVVLAVVLLHLWLRRRQHRWVETAVAAAGFPAAQVALLGAVLGRLENELSSAPRLATVLGSSPARGTTSPAAATTRLAGLLERLDYRRNMMFAPLELLSFWTFHAAAAVEAWRTKHGRELRSWLAAIGELEALTAFGGYAFEHPDDPFPEVVECSEAFLAAEGLAHPLLAEGAAIRNDVRLGGERRALVVSGSNMSGKSTLLRAVGLAVVMARAGLPVRCRSLTVAPLAVGASIRVVDSLLAGRSRFYAEIMRLKEIVDLLEGREPLLFLLDEVLHGTNSHDRRIGAEALVRHLVARGAVGLVTTHDLALAAMAETLAPAVANVHFADTLEGGEIRFDFVLHGGTVRHSNALALMRRVGLPVDGTD